jgi:hypothetical protein
VHEVRRRGFRMFLVVFPLGALVAFAWRPRRCVVPAGTGRMSHVTLAVLDKVSRLPVSSLSYAPPVVTSTTPGALPTDLTSGPVRVNGAGFGGPGVAGSVTVALSGVTSCGDTVAANISAVTVLSDGVLSLDFAASPGSVVAAWSVVVTVSGQASTALSVATRAPQVAQLLMASPADVRPVTLLIDGRDFGPTVSGVSGCPGDVSVSINDQPCAATTMELPHVQLRCAVLASSGVIRVVTSTGTAAVPYSVAQLSQPPLVVSVSPPRWSTDNVTVVTITGQRFGSLATDAFLALAMRRVAGGCDGAANATTTCTLDAPSAYSSSQVVCTVPAGVGSRFQLLLAGMWTDLSSPAGTWFGYSPPTLASVDPGLVPAAGGSVTLSGADFGTTPLPCDGVEVLVTPAPLGADSLPFDAARLQFDTAGLPAPVWTPCLLRSWRPSAITCDVPAGLDSALLVRVSVGGTTVTAPGMLGYQGPGVTNVSAAGPVGSPGGAVLTVVGSGFLVGPWPLVVTVGEAVCPPADPGAWMPSRLSCFAPRGAGTVPVRVHVPLQPPSAPVLLSYAPPVVHALQTPSGRPLEGGFLVVVQGSNFYPGLTSISIGDQVCVGVVVTDAVAFTEATCLAPPGPGFGTVHLALTVAGSAPARFLFVYDTPVVTSVSPSPCDAEANCAIEVTGRHLGLRNFLASPDPVVTVGGYPCVNLNLVNSSFLRCSAVSTVVGRHPVVVTLNNHSRSVLCSSAFEAASSLQPCSCTQRGTAVFTWGVGVCVVVWSAGCKSMLFLVHSWIAFGVCCTA